MHTEPTTLNGADASSASSWRDRVDFELFWSRPQLPLEDRFVAVISAAVSAPLWDALPTLVEDALGEKVGAQAVVETIIQCGIYKGFAASRAVLDRLQPVFDERNLVVDSDLSPAEDVDALDEAAIAMRRKLHGGRHSEGHADPSKPLIDPLYTIASRYGYGVIWNRPGLSLRLRFICALSSFTALGGAENSLRKFAVSAADAGLTVEDIREAVMQATPFCGFPRALSALTALEELFSSISSAQSKTMRQHASE